MDLIELEDERRLRREEAAAWLRQVADSLSRQNELQFVRSGKRFTVAVPDEVEMEVEVEIGDDGSSVEIELSW
jgi:amphi-Trp domain-containing protein